MLAICLPVIIGLCGMGIDLGMVYLESARLSRAVDASAVRLAKYYTSDSTKFRTRLIKSMDSNLQAFPNVLPSDFTGDGATPETFTAEKGGLKLSYRVDTNAFATGSNSAFPQPLTASSTFDSEDNPGPDRGGWAISPTGAYDGTPYDTAVLSSSYANLEVVTVYIEAEIEHDTYFLPIFYERAATVTLTESAEAKKFPGVTILILDNSQSMDENSDPKAYISLRDSVDIFLEQFDETKDFMGAVYFSNKGWISYPEKAPFVPRLNWDPRISELVQNTGNYENGYTMNPQTHATEAMRLAFNMVENFLAAFAEEDRISIPVNYVFFTDGGFTSVRTFARGPGFGGTSGSSIGSGDIHTKTKVPWFHGVKAVNYPASGIDGLILKPYNKNGSRRDSTDYDLKALIQDLDVDQLAGINGNLHRWKMNIHQSGNNKVNTNYSKEHNIQTGTGPYEDVEYGGHFWELGSDPSTTTPVMLPYDDDEDKDESPNKEYWEYADNETDKNNDIYPFSFPARINTVCQNWTTDASTSTASGSPFAEYSGLARPYYYHRHSTSANTWPGLPTSPHYKGRDIPNDELEWNRGLALYRNTHGEHNYRRKGKYDKDLYGAYHSYLDSNTKIYGNRTIHTQMLYPEYRMGNDLDKSDDAAPRKFWSWKKYQWVDLNGSSSDEGKIEQEADFVMEAQCLIARVKHNATIYTIILGKSNTDHVHYNMSNINQAGTAALYSDQNKGALYETDDTDALKSIFADVAAKIVVRITQ